MSAQDLNLKQAILAAMRQESPPTTQSGLRQHLQDVTLDECRKLVVGYLQKRTSEVLSFMPHRYPEPQQSLNDLGFDSMMAMELRHRIETELEVRIHAEVFIGTSTLAQIAGLLLDKIVLVSVIQLVPSFTGSNDDSEEITF